MELLLTPLPEPPAGGQPVEIVERKGRGHPDTLCDALAEELSIALSRFYLERFGQIFHHNVDKALLWAGIAAPRYGGGEVLSPLQIFLAGRATAEIEGVTVPIEELAVETARRWLGDHLHALDPRRHAEVRSLVRPGASNLVDLFRRQRRSGVWLANDTSCGVGYAPLSPLEQVVDAVERELTSRVSVEAHPEIGEDVKVLGVRKGDAIDLTLACAVVDRFIPNRAAYLEARERIRVIALETARRLTDQRVEVEVNCADDPASDQVYLTVTGTSAESGDDGQVGRGNRVGGLIAPGRPMVMEAAAGKNPVAHVGKLYNVTAHRIAAALVEGVPAVEEAQCFLVSRIGSPVARPPLVEIRLRAGPPVEELRPAVAGIVESHLRGIHHLYRDLLARAVRLF